MLAEDPLAPTTVRQPERIRDDHFADSLVALELARVRTAPAVADLGSGAGIPGLPLAIALPNTEVWLVESNGRKCEFIERATAAMELENAHVVNARAEAWPDRRSPVSPRHGTCTRCARRGGGVRGTAADGRRRVGSLARQA